MGYRYVVFGSGRQGVALAYDLALRGEANAVLLTDYSPQVAQEAVERLQRLLPKRAGCFSARICDVKRPAEVAAALTQADVAISAAPYRYNVDLTEAAVVTGVSFCDLGGNTAVVRAQLAFHEQARRAGVSVVPDCGLAPGLGNLLAAHGVAQLASAAHVHVRCGGLPQERVGPLGYKLLFNFQGLLNEYSGRAEFLREGRRVEVPTLTELEELEFSPPVGRCEAAVTSGGTSTCPETFAGRLQTYDYKTVRYPGHFAIVQALFELGCFDEHVALDDGAFASPVRIMQRLMEERLQFPDVHDLVVLRCTVRGREERGAAQLQYDLLDRHDEATGFTAMERTTAFPTALVAHLQARRLIEPGARPGEVAVPLETFWSELPAHDIRVELTKR